MQVEHVDGDVDYNVWVKLVDMLMEMSSIASVSAWQQSGLVGTHLELTWHQLAYL